MLSSQACEVPTSSLAHQTMAQAIVCRTAQGGNASVAITAERRSVKARSCATEGVFCSMCLCVSETAASALTCEGPCGHREACLRLRPTHTRARLSVRTTQIRSRPLRDLPIDTEAARRRGRPPWPRSRRPQAPGPCLAGPRRAGAASGARRPWPRTTCARSKSRAGP